MGSVDPLSVITVGGFGKQGLISNMLGIEDKGLLGSKDKKKSAPQSKAIDPNSIKTPTGPQANVNATLLASQGADRRRRLLSQSTGRPSQGPSIS